MTPEEMTDNRMQEEHYSDQEAAAEAPIDERNESGAEPADDESLLEQLQRENEMLQDELGRAKDQLLRKAAEFQNYRRRTEDEKRVLVDIGKESVIQQLLDVVDDLSRSVDAAQSPGATVETLRQGVEMVQRKLMDQLAKIGVEPIDAVGQPFNEDLHEGLMRQPAPEGTAPGIVLSEIQRGYKMNDRVLRHARVVVASEAEE